MTYQYLRYRGYQKSMCGVCPIVDFALVVKEFIFAAFLSTITRLVLAFG
ncbi:hypothetical protein N836_08535 [Leptolyngbya sp. Heron Island J]|nr:hypothetical protein N836_08535 [Leptolyngbya sp. Heron Island J]